MRKTGKRLMAAALAAVMAASVTACGSSGGTAGQTTETTKAAGETATTAGEKKQESGSEEEPITLSMAWWGGQERNEYTQKLLELYTSEHPNITFQTSPSGWDGYFDKLATQAAAGAMPDIVQMDYLYITTYANNGSVADLKPYIDNGTIDVTNIDPVLYGSGEINGKLAGMVLSSSLLAFTYNPEVLASAGVEEPNADWTWDDFIADCTQIAEKTDAYGMETNLSDNINVLNYYVRQRGEQLFSDDNKSLGYKDDAVFVDFVNMIASLVEKGAMPNPDQYAAIMAMGKESFPVVTGGAGFRNDWSNYATIVEGSNDTLKLVTPPMTADKTKALWVKPGMFFSIAETSADAKKQAAAEFINWFINSEEANDIILAERGTPVSSAVRSYLADSGKLTKKQIEMFDFVDDAVSVCADAPAPDPAGVSEISETYQTEIYNVLYGNKTPEKAAADFRTMVNEILERNN